MDLEQEHREWQRREAMFREDYPEGFTSLSQEIDALQRFGLYCGTCSLGMGCEHGVPTPKLD